MKDRKKSRYDPRADRWMYGPELNKARWGHTLISDGSRLLALGGQTDRQVINSMWKYVFKIQKFNHIA